MTLSQPWAKHNKCASSCEQSGNLQGHVSNISSYPGHIRHILSDVFFASNLAWALLQHAGCACMILYACVCAGAQFHHLITILVIESSSPYIPIYHHHHHHHLSLMKPTRVRPLDSASLPLPDPHVAQCSVLLSGHSIVNLSVNKLNVRVQ